MKNKLLLTTALVGSVAIAGASFAETKVGGDVEMTYKSKSYDKETGTSTTQTGQDGFGSEENIKISTKKELDNGMTMKAGMKLEDGVSDSNYIEFSAGNTSVHFGADYGNNSNGVLIPTVGDHYVDAGVATTAATQKTAGEEAHDALHVGLAQKFEGGVVYLNYAPSSNKSSGDSGVTDAGGSITEIGLKANVQGFSINLGATDAKADTDASTSEGEERSYAIGYSMGQFAVGAHKRTHDDGGTAAATNDYENTSYGVTYAANDQISVGLQYGEASNGDDTVDEETTAFSVGYSLGGMGVELTYSQTDNIGNVSGEDGEAIQVRTVAKF